MVGEKCEIGKLIRPCALAFGQSHNEIHCHFTFAQFTQCRAGEQLGNLLIDRAGADAITSCLFAIRHDAHLGNRNLRLDVDIRES